MFMNEIWLSPLTYVYSGVTLLKGFVNIQIFALSSMTDFDYIQYMHDISVIQMDLLVYNFSLA
jgi:hypothetical protein